MTYVVTENCIACKYTDCVEVCPVDCFYEGENMLVIHPDECIDCGVCEPECPADAIRPDTEPDTEKWVEFNRKYSEVWPVLVTTPRPAARRRGAGRQAGQAGEATSPRRRARAAEPAAAGSADSRRLYRSIRPDRALKRLRQTPYPVGRDGLTSPEGEFLL